MRTVRPLLTVGNGKLSASVHHFSIPAGPSCPGKSDLCYSRCYARKNRFLYPQVQERLAWNFEQAKRRDFVDRMVDELYRKGILAMRWHCAGDIFSPAYARKMLEIVGRSSHTQFWLYTRSWRVKTIAPLLHALSAMPNMKLWLSADAETGWPGDVPAGARVAWMMTEENEQPDQADLIFLDHPLRTERIALPLLGKVCPTETPAGKAKGTTCATCQVCYT